MTVNYFQQPGFFQFLAAIAQTWQVGQGCRAVASAVAPFTALAIPVNHEGQGNWRRLQRQRGTVSVVTNADVEQLQNLCAFSGDVSILGLLWFC
jgi:hypothetical protein